MNLRPLKTRGARLRPLFLLSLVFTPAFGQTASCVTDAVTDVPVIHVKYPDDCCPSGWRCKYSCWEATLRTRVGQKWWTLRCFVNKLVDHKWFEAFIIVAIIGSSVSLVSRSIAISRYFSSQSALCHQRRFIQFCAVCTKTAAACR